jgi:nucleotide-binding universal stress UspA family protein
MSPPFSRLLVAIDDSDPAKAAAESAIRLARECGAEIVFANAIDARVIVDLGELVKDQATALLARAQDDAAARGVKAAGEILVGELATTLKEFAGEIGADLVAIGTHGRQGLGHFILGSAAEGVLRAAEVPVLVVRTTPEASAAGKAAFPSVLVAHDGSDAARAAASVAIRYAAHAGAAVTFCTIVESEAVLLHETSSDVAHPVSDSIRAAARDIVESARDEARAQGVDAEASVREGIDVGEGIIEAAREHDARLIAMGSRGRVDAERSALGSACKAVARNSPVPVLVAHAPHEAEAR